MTKAEWQSTPAVLSDDDALLHTAMEVYRTQYHRWFEGALNTNMRLPIETRALRRIGPWRIFLLLTPWMLARLFFHDGPAPIAIPNGWSADIRGSRDDSVIGPAVAFSLFDASQKAHLNYHEQLGHYLIQPLVLAMHEYPDADAVFAAWGNVIKTRDENMKRKQVRCPMQEEISRREFFGGRTRRPQQQ